MLFFLDVFEAEKEILREIIMRKKSFKGSSMATVHKFYIYLFKNNQRVFFCFQIVISFRYSA